MTLDTRSDTATLPEAPPAAALGCGPDGEGQLSPDDMMAKAQDAAGFLKALAHEGRLMILCFLSTGEKSVTELENLLGSRQAAVSQQLARLRLEGLVTCRRDGTTIFYSLADTRAERVVGLVYEMFCKGA